MEYNIVLKSFLDENGKLTKYPSKHKPRIYALFMLAEKFETGVRYTEKEINEIISEAHTFNDICLLRRELFERKFLRREKDGSVYWKNEEQPTLSKFGLE